MTSPPAAARLAAPTPEAVVLLQSVRSYPSVSLLVSTSPAPRMTGQDSETLSRLAQQAVARLEAERTDRAADVVRALQRTLPRVLGAPTTRGLGVFVNEATQEVFGLPVPVADRAVVDPTFATRDLVRALHRTPRHVVLLLTELEARLFDGVGDRLEPVSRSAFPLRAPTTRRDPRTADVDAFFRVVDRALRTYRTLHPSPLVLVGAERTLARFRSVSRHLERLAGAVTGSHARTPLRDLLPQIREVLDGYLASRQQEALELIGRRQSEHRVVSGISSGWLAARTERPEMLVVEEGFFHPARLSADGDFLSPAEDVEHPDVVDDVVDELIEVVIQRGGWVAFAEDGALAEHDRVALTVR